VNNLFYNSIVKECDEIYDKKKFKFLKNKKILITGATGLLGQFFIGFFLESLKYTSRPKKITLIYKSNLPKHLLFLKKNKYFNLKKINLSKDKLSFIKKQSYIIHLACYGQPAKFIKNPVETFKLNTEILEKLLKKTEKTGSFLYLSSSEIYSGLNHKCTEDKVGNTNTDHIRAPYIQSKKAGETIINIYRNYFNVNAKSARLCLAYGPGNKKNDSRVLYELITKGLLKHEIKMLSTGFERRSYIYVADAVKMLINILFFGKKSIYNVGGKNIITIIQLANKISKILKVPIKKIKSNKFNIGSPNFAKIEIKNYENEFGEIKLLPLNKGLLKTIEWQKHLLNVKNEIKSY
jgi:nucleoside-diphosphate-sugar epimerase